MTNQMYDLVFLGAGPGGYVAAERAAAAGLKTLLIEEKFLGGVCLNEGCIPSKALLHTAKLYTNALGSQNYGIIAEGVKYDFASAMGHKTKVVESLRRGIASTMKKLGVEVVPMRGRLIDKNTVEAGDVRYTGKNIVIATGSSPVVPPFPGVDLPHVHTSSTIFDLDKLPQKAVIIGGGVIGCEFASYFSGVGVDTTVVEMLPEICPGMDTELAVMLRQSLKKVKFELGARVESIDSESVTFSREGKQQKIPADLVLMSIGRKPNVNGIGLESVGVDFSPRGIRVNEKMETNIPGVYAIGDVIGTSMLAHSASRMGEVVVHNLSGRKDRMRYHAIPLVIYTSPEVASVGLTETQAKEKGMDVNVSKLPMGFNGRFLAENAGKRGICKVVSGKEDGLLLGVQMLGAGCSEMIYGAAAMIESEFRIKDAQEVIFPHPTVSEIFRDTLFAHA